MTETPAPPNPNAAAPSAPREAAPFKHRLFLALIPVATGLIRLLMGSLRLRLIDPRGLSPQARPASCIYAFWHQHQLLNMFVFRGHGIQVLVSKSRDGDYISAALERFGFGTVRSSTSSGKVTALRGLAREIKRGRHAAITPDGPRGPLHRAQPGVAFLAAMTGAQVVPFGCAVASAWRLKSWDRFEIPKPFSRAAIVYGDAFPVPSSLDEHTLPGWLERFDAELVRLDAAAAAELERMKRP